MNKKQISLIVLLALFFMTRLTHLTALPVFADEAIYIRWAQLIRQEPLRYISLPILDGKPPLYMLLLAVLLPLGPLDPLLISRLLNVGIAALSVIFMFLATKRLTKSATIAYLSAAIYITMPFTFFFNRMGLIDPLVGLGVTLYLYGLSLDNKQQQASFVSLSFGPAIALWAKTSSLLLLPSFVWLIWSTRRGSARSRAAIATGLGLVLFALLRFSPTFPSLFSRSQDFSFSISQVLGGQVSQIAGNSLKIGKWFGMYLTWPFLIGVVYAARQKKHGAITLKLIVASALFIAPFVIVGKVVSARYLFPVVSFLVPALAIALNEGWKHHRLPTTVLVTASLIQSLHFIGTTLANPRSTPLAHEDHVEYLSEWSAGFGIPEVRDFIKEQAKDNRIAVATEGYFGTLPDGLLMYFIEAPELANIEIFGIGQPIDILPEELIEKAKHIKTYLVINQHRLRIPLEGGGLQLIDSYPKPEGPPLLLLEVIPEEL